MADPALKFSDPDVTAKGERRAWVGLAGLRTLWINTGTLCNLACANCYMESSPRNDALAYITGEEVARFLEEARLTRPELEEVGFTGGEPFMNPDLLAMLQDVLAGGWRALVLTNAMRPMQRLGEPLATLRRRFPGRLSVRVSLDHHTAAGHERVRGERSWAPALEGLHWLAAQGFDLAVAARLLWADEGEAETRAAYADLFAREGLPIDAQDPGRLVLFPEMDAHADTPEISEACWGLLGRSPSSVMCSRSRMVVKRRGAERPVVVACTLLPYAPGFELGETLAQADQRVALNHPHCSRFCVLGGASCSG